MFVGSAKTPEELAYKLLRNTVDLLSEETYQEFLKSRYPNCTKHYNNWTAHGSTWKLERDAQIALFTALESQVVDPSALLDYTLLKINPKPNQILGIEDILKGVDAIEGKRLMEIGGYVSGDEGFRKKCKMYER